MNDEPRATSRDEVIAFLVDYKAVARDQKPLVISRQKNLKVLISLGMTLKEQWTIILGLTVADYVLGPEPDRERRGYVWVFGKIISQTELYIKLKLTEYVSVDSGQLVRKAIVISFHPAEWPLHYPFK